MQLPLSAMRKRKGDPLKVLCPECRAELTLPPGGAVGLPCNYSVVKLLEAGAAGAGAAKAKEKQAPEKEIAALRTAEAKHAQEMEMAVLRAALEQQRCETAEANRVQETERERQAEREAGRAQKQAAERAMAEQQLRALEMELVALRANAKQAQGTECKCQPVTTKADLSAPPPAPAAALAPLRTLPLRIAALEEMWSAEVVTSARSYLARVDALDVLVAGEKNEGALLARVAALEWHSGV